MKPGSLNLLEPSGPVQACNGISLPLPFNSAKSKLLNINTLVTGYGDFRTSVASGRRRATEISVFAYGWLEEGFGLCCVLALMLYNHNISLEKVCRGH